LLLNEIKFEVLILCTFN